MSSGNFREIRPSSRASSVTGFRSGRADRSTSRGSMKDHALSVHLWGRGDQEQDDPRAHWAIMAYERGGTSGDIFHVRKWDNDYKYERSTRPLETTSSFGRSEVVYLSRSGRDHAAVVLDNYGNNRRNLPDGVDRRCQEWTVGSLAALEAKEIVPRGTATYWGTNVGKSSPFVGSRLEADGRSWISKNGAGERYEGPVDARFGDKSKRPPVGKLNTAKFSRLLG
ncbi:hypothetical protein MaudCBS49596_002080 [Microsporum audouinii]